MSFLDDVITSMMGSAFGPAWLEDLLEWQEPWLPPGQSELERAVKQRLRNDEDFRLIIATVMANADLTITVRREPENRLLPMPLEYA